MKSLPAVGALTISVFLSSSALAVDYATEIQPILQRSCLDCHGPEKAKSELRVDQRAQLLRGGDSGLPAIVPGQSEKSHLIDLIKGTDPDEVMPPKGERLSEAEIALIEKWIDDGAQWPGQMDAVAELKTDHWSFQPVRRPQVPGTAPNPIDAFLNQQLNQAGISPNAPADPQSLIRRASVILTGLPPLPARVQQFVADSKTEPDTAYATLVEELLGSPHFGERWAQHWLDVIRWAESNGSEANLYRKNAWLYRDYVVRAFNDNLPYDQFVRQQIAGDSLGTGDAMGFLVAGPHVPAATVGQEASAIRQARADRMDEIIQTVGASVMGITMGCARCHNHKFDPITITDYYAMTAVFQDIEFGSRPPEYAPNHPRQQRAEQIWSEILRLRKTLSQMGPWEENWGAFAEVHFPTTEATALRFQFKTAYVGLDELEVFDAADPQTNLAHRQYGTQVSGPAEMVTDGRNRIVRLNDGEYGTMAWRARAPKGSKERPWAQYDFNAPVKANRIRLSSNREYFYETEYLSKMPKLQVQNYDLAARNTAGEWIPVLATTQLRNGLNNQHPNRAAILKKLQERIQALQTEGPRASFVGRLIEPQVTKVLHRGSPENPRDEVYPAGPEILSGNLHLDSQTEGAARRAAFASWITAKENPLTARVLVNRIWHHIFGRGLVSTTSDFGEAGALPSHPELLDWLAAEFVAPTRPDLSPWSMKGLIRLLVHSDAFRRSSTPSSAGLTADADAVLLWRFPPRRVEAEVIRDGILQASGKLDRTLGGQSYRIHNVKKTYAQWEVLDNHGPNTWRRMLYQERMRRVDDRMFTAFDFPDCGQVRAKRPISTTPLQALNLMNSPFVVEQASFISQRAQSVSANDTLAAEVQECFSLLLGRQPEPPELQAALALAKSKGLALVCRSLINSNEFAFLP